jgi:cyclic beta-1,2-glucan synthetase
MNRSADSFSVSRSSKSAPVRSPQSSVPGAPTDGGAAHLRRLEGNAERLREAYLLLAEDVHRSEALPPAAEWLLDNFHMVEAEVRNVAHDLPEGYHRKLARAATADEDRTRIELLADDLLAHSDGRLEAARVTRYLASFQTVEPLSIGELWAWPSVLKLALLDRLHHLVDELMAARRARADAVVFLQQIDIAARGDAALPELPESLPTPFVVQLVQRLREYGSPATPLRTALEQRLARGGRTIEEAIREETQRQATEQVSVGNVFTSLRFCAIEDWRELIERVSLVEHVLRRDPAGVYARMDFLSRDRYRHAIEGLAGPSGPDQVQAALDCVDAARAGAEHAGAGERIAHVGYHLVGAGRPAFAASLPRGTPLTSRLRRQAFAHASILYLGAFGLLTLLGLFVAAAYTASAGGASIAIAVATVLALLPASELAATLLQRLVADLVKPRRLVPRPATAARSLRTMVVVPTLSTASSAPCEAMCASRGAGARNPDASLRL